MKNLILCLAILISPWAAAQSATEWQVDKAHTSVNFEVGHFFSTVHGNFTEFEGDFHFAPDNLEGSKFTFKIPVSSIDTDNDKRNGHLKSADFFDAEKYPYITFESTGFEMKGEGSYLVHGKLTIKDVTKEVKVPFEMKGMMDHPMKEGSKLLGLSFDTEIDRTDFNVGTGDWASDAVVGDDVEVEIDMELISG